MVCMGQLPSAAQHSIRGPLPVLDDSFLTQFSANVTGKTVEDDPCAWPLEATDPCVLINWPSFSQYGYLRSETVDGRPLSVSSSLFFSLYKNLPFQ